MPRPPRHRAPAAPRCPISAGMFRPTPSSNRRRAHPHPVAVRAGAPRAPQRPLQARQQAPRVLAVQPRLRQLVRAACKTADATTSDREATPCGWLFVCPHLFISASPGGPNPRRGSNPSSQGELELYCPLYSLGHRCADQRSVLLDRVKPEVDRGRSSAWPSKVALQFSGELRALQVDKQGLHALVSKEAKAAASPGLVATECQDRRFLRFTALDLLLAFSSFRLPPCFAFCGPLATLALFRFGLLGVDLFHLPLAFRFPLLRWLQRGRRWRLRRSRGLLRWLRRLRRLCGGGQDDSRWRRRFIRSVLLIPDRVLQG